MNITQRRTDVILKALCEKHYAEYCTHYGEPGYSDPDKGIIFADWNDISKSIGDYLEEAGFKCEWSDEWSIDYNNDKAYRTSPDSYGWISQIAYTDDGEMLTPDDSVEEWIDEMKLTDKGQTARIRALPDRITAEELTELGYVAINGEFESGHHGGQSDDPAAIAVKAFEAGATAVVFRLSESSQFYIRFQGFAMYDDEVQS